MTLTGSGKLLMRHATALFVAERAAEEEMAALRALHRGSLNVGASTAIATYHLPPFLGAFHKGHPRIELHLTSNNARAIELATLVPVRSTDGLVALLRSVAKTPSTEPKV